LRQPCGLPGCSKTTPERRRVKLVRVAHKSNPLPLKDFVLQGI
jgi:hypothetical protein